MNYRTIWQRLKGKIALTPAQEEQLEAFLSGTNDQYVENESPAKLRKLDAGEQMQRKWPQSY